MTKQARALPFPEAIAAEHREMHEALAARFPMAGINEWRRGQVIDALDLLTRYPEPERDRVANLAFTVIIQPRRVIALLLRLLNWPAVERERLYLMAESGDPELKIRAQQDAFGVPPMPDPRILMLIDAMRALAQAIKVRDDDLQSEAERLHDGVRALLKTVRDRYHKERDDAVAHLKSLGVKNL